MSVIAARMPDEAAAAPTGRAAPRLVRAWLVLLALMVLAMVAVGGATRLTGSGLSITEWKPVTGAVPPMSDGAWDAEFAKYRASSQYQNLNRGMELPEFRTIYWWEWGHRQLGRLIGLVFALPLVAFRLSGAIGTALALRLLFIGALGGLQATIGWIMVASGLEPGMTAVAPLKLMLHLVLASAILALLAWTADDVGQARRETLSPRGRGKGEGGATCPEEGTSPLPGRLRRLRPLPLGERRTPGSPPCSSGSSSSRSPSADWSRDRGRAGPTTPGR